MSIAEPSILRIAASKRQGEKPRLLQFNHIPDDALLTGISHRVPVCFGGHWHDALPFENMQVPLPQNFSAVSASHTGLTTVVGIGVVVVDADSSQRSPSHSSKQSHIAFSPSNVHVPPFKQY